MPLFVVAFSKIIEPSLKLFFHKPFHGLIDSCQFLFHLFAVIVGVVSGLIFIAIDILIQMKIKNEKIFFFRKIEMKTRITESGKFSDVTVFATDPIVNGRIAASPQKDICILRKIIGDFEFHKFR